MAAHKAYCWETGNQFYEAVCFVVLIGIGAYLVQLLLDAGASKALPIIGEL